MDNLRVVKLTNEGSNNSKEKKSTMDNIHIATSSLTKDTINFLLQDNAKTIGSASVVLIESAESENDLRAEICNIELQPEYTADEYKQFFIKQLSTFLKNENIYEIL